MENLSVHVFEHILCFLNRIDQYNAAIAVNHNFEALSTIIHRRIVLVCEYRFQQAMIPSLITCRPDTVTLLDLTGIFWIPSEVILQTCLQLVNLESLYLWGTNVIVDGTKDLQEFKALHKVKCIAVGVINFNGWRRSSSYGYRRGQTGMGVQYCLLQRRDDGGGQGSLAGCRAREEEEDEPLENPFRFSKYDIELRVDLIERNLDKFLPIISNDWMILTNETNDQESFRERLKSNFTKLYHDDFFDEQKIRKRFEDTLRNEKNLYLHLKSERWVNNCCNCCNCAQLSFEAITILVNLTSLHIDVFDKVKDNFLKPIFKSCGNLKKLSIKCYDEKLSWKDLKYASEKLKDLSLVLKHKEDFSLNNFLALIGDAPNVKLQRLYLNYGYVALSEKFDINSKLAHFMSSNPQLMFMCIITDDPDFQFETVSKLLASFKKEEYQWFQCKKRLTYDYDSHTHIDIGNIPLQHVDMLNLSLRLNALPRPPRRKGCLFKCKPRRINRLLIN